MSELNYRRIPTDYSVYVALVRDETGIVRENMAVFSSYTNIVENGMSTIFTEWGIKDSPIPIVSAETKYESEYDKEIEGTRTHSYWLCVPILEEE